MLELEKTYLAKKIPDLKNCKKKEIIDVYIPATARHPVLRIRKNGDKYEITKKIQMDEDKSQSHEHTVPLTEEEYKEFSKVPGKIVRKIRHYYEYKGRTAEIDIFQEYLQGLVLVDFEFDNVSEKDAFNMPEFCLADVTQEEFLAGGMLCGKTYADIEPFLKKFNYKKL